jgi:hypothetical protein
LGEEGNVGFHVWKCKVYGFALSLNLLFIGFISKGMPGYFLLGIFGVPLVLCFACLLIAFGFYAAHAIGEILDRKTNRIVMRCRDAKLTTCQTAIRVPRWKQSVRGALRLARRWREGLEMPVCV